VSLSELLVIMLVTVLVFGPKKLPMLAYHLGVALRYLLNYKQLAVQAWQQLLSEQKLQENLEKAQRVDQSYE
jgi:sec-independent protein translocase protein TatB